MRYDIIIPHYGSGLTTDLCLRCLQSIRLYSNDYRIIFVDNGSPEFSKLEPELRHHRHLLIRNARNVGFVEAANEGLCSSTAERIVILNNDTEVAPHWLHKLDTALGGKVGLSGPRTNARNCWQGNWKGPQGIFLLPRTAMLAFFCVMLRRDVIQRVGFLDRGFGVGFGDDDDYCYRAHLCGFRLALVSSLLIHHHHRTTFKSLYKPADIQHMQRMALARFRRKWSLR